MTDAQLPPRGSPYMAFSSDSDRKMAVLRFKDKYSADPQHVFTDRGLLLIGPVPGSTPWTYPTISIDTSA